MLFRILAMGTAALLAVGLVTSSCLTIASAQQPGGWLSWRGPDQNGSSRAIGLPNWGDVFRQSMRA